MDQRRKAEEADEIVRKSRQILETKRFQSHHQLNSTKSNDHVKWPRGTVRVQYLVRVRWTNILRLTSEK